MNDFYDVTGKRELFIDTFLIDNMRNMLLSPHYPVELPSSPTKPCGAYVTIMKTPRNYWLYYRNTDGVYQGDMYNNHPGEYVGVAQSTDGLTWELPQLNRFPGKPVPGNTLIYGKDAITHNFVPFYDTNPACKPAERYKAVAGVRETKGLFAFHSADGLNWRQYGDAPIVAYEPEKNGGHMLDSQNVVFYSECEQCYVMYIRVWKTADGFEHLRSFAKVTSRDFLHWSEPEYLTVNRKDEHLYVSGLEPYARAPHIYVGAATRYFGDRGSATDVTFIFSRNGRGVVRPCPGPWIKPGLDPERWQDRMNYIAWGMVQNGDDEIIMYHNRKPLMYKFRTDGFVSLSSAGLKTGSFMTKVLSRRGGALEFNLSTSAGGFFQAEICDKNGNPVPGFSFRNMKPYWGDAIRWEPDWNGRKISELPHMRFRLHIKMRECDLFSVNFPE
ncbi:MAG: hypothetical protein IJS15_02250 [Victivallales bacterium]|nr:hypothetical protein [Victivallales bacterium]